MVGVQQIAVVPLKLHSRTADYDGVCAECAYATTVQQIPVFGDKVCLKPQHAP